MYVLMLGASQSPLTAGYVSAQRGEFNTRTHKEPGPRLTCRGRGTAYTADCRKGLGRNEGVW